MSIMIKTGPCEAAGRPAPEAVCPVRRGPHLWLVMGHHEHVGAEHGRIRDEQCYACHAVKACPGTVGEAEAREQMMEVMA